MYRYGGNKKMKKDFRFRGVVQFAATVIAPIAFLTAGMPLAHAGTIILEGSDAVGYHCSSLGNAAACTYTAQLWEAVDGASDKPIAVFGTPAGSPITNQGATVQV